MQTQVYATDDKEPAKDILLPDMVVFALAREANGKTNANSRASRAQGGPKRFFVTPKQYVIILCFFAIFSTAAYFYWVAKAVTYPYEFDYGEGIVLWLPSVHAPCSDVAA
jgi:hypothetical protein